MSLFVVDVESDGPCPGIYSMVSFAAVKVSKDLDEHFYAETRPVTDQFIPEALAISCTSREDHLTYPHPEKAMHDFAEWVLRSNSKGRPVFLSDNLAFDWQWINYYFHRYVGKNPFGYSGRRIGDLWCGMKGNAFAKWKHLRDTPHDHNPLNDALGNAEALIKMKGFGLKGIML
jgi:DNA polymerase III epsilon subunit-like protein